MYRIYRDTPLGNAKHFNFDVYTNAISKIILNKENRTPFSIVINGRWGCGKTTLMKTLREKLDSESGTGNNRKVKTVWFDAWKYSETDSMLAALIREIFAEMEESNRFRDKLKAKIFGVSERVDLLKQMSDLARILTLGQGPEFEKWVKMPKYQEKLSFYDVFQEYIRKILLIFVLQKKDGTYTDEDGILAIFIDDLDRCSPKNITKVLESINLFFDQEGCFFILGADISLLSNAINKEYNDFEGFSGRDYIKKMIQLQFDLPSLYEDDIKKFMEDELEIGEPLKIYFDIITKGLESNQREIKRFLNSLYLMKILSESIKNLDFEEELLIKWSILNFSSEYFIKEVKTNYRLMIEMQSISKMENEKDIENYIEEIGNKNFKEICNRFKNDKKILRVLGSGESEYRMSDIPNYIFLSSVAPKGPEESLQGLFKEDLKTFHIFQPCEDDIIIDGERIDVFLNKLLPKNFTIEFIPKHESLELAKEDMDDLKESSILVVNVNKSLDSVGYWELGYAMGSGIKIIGFHDGMSNILIPDDVKELIHIPRNIMSFSKTINHALSGLKPKIPVILEDWDAIRRTSKEF